MEPELHDVVVTAVVPYGERDLVVRLFSQHRGRIGTFARGARNSKKRFGAALQPLAFGAAELRPRRGSDLFGLEALDPDPCLFRLAQDPLAWGRASYLAEVTERLLPEAEPCPPLFVALRQALALLADGADARLLRAFELRLLAETGYLPDLGSASDVPGREPSLLDSATGELVALEGPGRVPFPAEAREAAAALLLAPFEAPPVIEAQTLKAVSRLFAVHLRRMGAAELKSVAFLRALGAGGRSPPRR